MNDRLSLSDLPNINPVLLEPIDVDALIGPNDERHAPRILILYGSLRTRSYSRFLAVEAARLLRWFGCEVTLFDPACLPLLYNTDANHTKVHEFRNRAT